MFLKVFDGTIIGIEFFLKSMDILNRSVPNCVFIIASDDPEWVIENFDTKRSDIFTTGT